MSKNTSLAKERLEDVSQKTSKFLDRFTGMSAKAEKHSSTVLVGTAGGIIGSLAAIGICQVATISIAILGTPLAALGVVGGILMSRGFRRIKIERLIAENRMAADEILDRIKALPRNTPDHVKERLWNSYSNTIGSYGDRSALLLNPPKSEAPLLQITDSEKFSPQSPPASLPAPPGAQGSSPPP